MAEFTRVATPLTPEEMALIFLDSYQRIHGHLPDRNTAELYLALVSNENANGKAIYNHNWGNVIAVGSENYTRPPWYDPKGIAAIADPKLRARYEKLHEQMIAKPGTVPTKFAAYGSHSEGADRWVKVLAGERYTGTRRAAKLGDAEQFAYFIWSEGYCPNDACSKLGPTYAKLRDHIRAQGYVAALPAADDSTVHESNGGYKLRAGHQYRITESAGAPVDQANLKRMLEDSGASDVVFATEGTRYAYTFTTPPLALEYVYFQAVVPGARIDRVVEVPMGDTRRMRKATGLVLAATLSLLGVMVLSHRGAL